MDLERAEAALVQHGRFPSVNAALEFYWKCSSTMSSPKGLHIHGESDGRGGRVLVDVDGGEGGDLDGHLAWIVTIGQVLARLGRSHPLRLRLLELTLREGRSYRSIERLVGLRRSAIGAEVHAARAWLEAELGRIGAVHEHDFALVMGPDGEHWRCRSCGLRQEGASDAA